MRFAVQRFFPATRYASTGMLDPQRFENNPFWVDEKEGHEWVALKCLQLMSKSDCLMKDVGKLRRPGTLQSEMDN